MPHVQLSYFCQHNNAVLSFSRHWFAHYVYFHYNRFCCFLLFLGIFFCFIQLKILMMMMIFLLLIFVFVPIWYFIFVACSNVFFSSLKLRRLKLVGKVRNNIIRRGLLPSLVCSVFRLFIVFFSILFWNDVIVRIARFGLFSWIGWNKMN